VAAVSGSQTAASLELATGGDAVMAIGGFSGLGGNITLAKFEADVKAGDIHYYIAGGFGGGGFPGATTGDGGFPGATTGGGGFPGAAGGGGGFPGAAGDGGSPGAAGGGSVTTGRSAVGSLFGGPGGGAGGPGGAAGGPGGPGGRGGSSTQAITSWVEAHYQSETIGGETVYNLTEPK
jgi:hypothetical protein